MIRELETQGVVSKTHSSFNSPIWLGRKSDGEWRLTVDYRALNEATPPLSAAMPDMLELQYKLESKAAKWYATIDIANTFFSIPLAAECRPQSSFTWRGVQYTWNQLPQGWKHSPTICHGLIIRKRSDDFAGRGNGLVTMMNGTLLLTTVVLDSTLPAATNLPQENMNYWRRLAQKQLNEKTLNLEEEPKLEFDGLEGHGIRGCKSHKVTCFEKLIAEGQTDICDGRGLAKP
ncbi:hypothetical protein DUI87_07370 [Hirundo rustica rustica]|uniref:ribonuclease H n=1 Tax=Hirundo rustica rustica TaxID=333673 RepID=A0A3M0KPQ9_HIRRU|nr:hypothetical protein DUI87_07370 [Hirundo rustica rustica]